MRIQENSQATGSKDLGMKRERVWGGIMIILVESLALLNL